MVKLDRCPSCESKLLAVHPAHGISPMYRVDEMVVHSVVSFYNRCLSCGLVFQNPRMSDEEVDAYYSSGKYRAEVNMTQERMDDDEKARADFIYKYVYDNATQSRTPKSHLDIGCSRGYLLNKVGAGKRVGLDMNKDYLTEPDIEFYSEWEKVKGKFEVVTMIEVLEHLSYPEKALQSIASWLSKDGSALISVPSDKAVGGPLRLAHLYYFEPWVLISMCEKAGLKTVGVAYTPNLLLTLKRS